MTLLLDVASPFFLIAIPFIVLILVIGGIGTGVYFIVRAVKKKSSRQESDK